MKALNCGNCPHLDVQPIANMCVVGCGKTGKMVPHQADNGPLGKGPITITCWRIPMNCPRPDTDVENRSPDNTPSKTTWTTFEWTP